MDKVIWICIPTYNEVENLQRTTRRIWEVLPDAQILIIDDASPDGTGRLADDLARKDPRLGVLHRREKAGLGAAYLAGFREVLARGATHIVQMDADLSHNPSILPMLIDALDAHDFAVGSRLVEGGGVEGWAWYRQLISRLGNLYADWMLNLPIRDLTGGFNAYRADVLARLDDRRFETTGYGFQIELKWFALTMGFRGVEVPIVFQERELGHSKISSFVSTKSTSPSPSVSTARLKSRPSHMNPPASKIARSCFPLIPKDSMCSCLI